MDIRPAVAGERRSVVAVVAEAFGEPDDGRVATMLDALDATGVTRADLVAVDGARVVGHVRLSLGWIDARERLVPALVLSPLAVAPELHGRGTGTRLVAAALRAADDHGAPAVFLEGAPGYYGSRGFAPASAHGFGRPSPRIPDPAFQVAFCAAYEPWMTGGVVYPQAFWDTDTVGLRDPRLAQVEEQLGLPPSPVT